MNEIQGSPETWMREFAQTGSADAFEALVRRYLPMVQATAVRCCDGAALADDVVQMVFIDFAKRLPRLEASDRIGAWLHRATVYRARDVMKSERRRERREQQAAAMMNLEKLPENEQWSALSPRIDGALQALRQKDREVILLRYLEGNDIAELTRLLGIGESAVKKRLGRAMQRLRKALRHRGFAVGSPALLALMPSGTDAAVVSQAWIREISAVSLAKVSRGGFAVWWFHCGPIPRIAWLSVAGTLLAGAWPMLPDRQHREIAGPAASSGLVLEKQLVRQAAFRPPVPPARPAVSEDMTVPEIVDALAELFAHPLSRLDEERCRQLFSQIPDAQAKEALLLIDETWPPAVKRRCDNDINYRGDLCGKWADREPEAAIAWALDRLRPQAVEYLDRFFWSSCVAARIFHWAHQDWENAWPWIQRGIRDGTLLHNDSHMNIPFDIGRGLHDLLIKHLGTTGAIDALAELQNLSASQDHNMLRELGYKLESDADFQYLMSTIPKIASPTGRVSLREATVGYWGRHHRASAVAWVEALPTAMERSRFGLELAFNWPREGEPIPDYKAQVAWWESLDPAPPSSLQHKAVHLAVTRWLWHDPQAAAEWLVRTENSPLVYGSNIVYELIRRADRERQPGPDWETTSFELIRNWKEADPEKFTSRIENTRHDHRHDLEALEVLDTLEAHLNSATP